ncbi:glycoside hydrolase family 43 protein [Microterricola viridarii]|uniref:Beta-xylosidase n=1 Tax=Microterricola viridarii TaxID=412690 RepID=A0A0Y0MPH3_9MICO|nr:glycoside hydrolase family 43 protein [Microterricola viridarii]AMB57608.1 beta-xylosidase [Microterricola viridarii]
MSLPILPGFHPDPSICRVGDDYYLVTSSFEYFPGVPIFHSTDLLNWTQIGNVLDRPSQLPLTAESGGIFAPTLRFHDGLFWMITTQIDRVAEGHLIVTASDPRGPWSEPVFTTGTVGIDPDLAWDENGACHLSWTRYSPQGSEIVQARLDPASGALLSEPRPLWAGTGLAHAEGPHLYRRGDWWYLLIAEGGTERGHAVSIARSRSIDGPFESNPANPILSHRSTDHPVQNTGHADLVELPNGDWAMVYLGVRPRGMTPGFHVNGRETFLASIDWAEDWPVVDESRYLVPPGVTDFVDLFEAAEPDPRWISPGGPAGAFLTRGVGGGVTVPPLREAPDGFLGVRTRDTRWQAELTITAGDAALVLRLDAAHLVRVETDAGCIRASARIGGLDIPLGQAERPAEGVILAIRADDAPAGIGVRSGPDILRLGVVRAGVFAELASLDGRYVSTEVAGGFTGRVIGFSAAERGGTISTFATHRIEEDDA